MKRAIYKPSEIAKYSFNSRIPVVSIRTSGMPCRSWSNKRFLQRLRKRKEPMQRQRLIGLIQLLKNTSVMTIKVLATSGENKQGFEEPMLLNGLRSGADI